MIPFRLTRRCRPAAVRGQPAARRARAIAANNIVNAAAMVISSAVTMGLIAFGVSIPGLFLLTGTATVAVAVLFWRMLPLLTVAQAT